MPTRTGKIHIEGNPERVFEFLSDPENLKRITPGAASVQGVSEGRFLLSKSSSPATSAFLRTDRSAKRLEWGTDDGGYSGWLEVTANGDGSDITVEITTREQVQGAAGVRSGDDKLKDGLELLRRHISLA
ncbi:SRPBCC family protein [Ensifer aridi]|uniref:SRPBCC family protein n=1 Tax=Ensifer aridi TaxID=1708715 RepID=UPI000A11FD1A|nr:SRPBCC family protein [Ensifer aridi]